MPHYFWVLLVAKWLGVLVGLNWGRVGEISRCLQPWYGPHFDGLLGFHVGLTDPGLGIRDDFVEPRMANHKPRFGY